MPLKAPKHQVLSAEEKRKRKLGDLRYKMQNARHTAEYYDARANMEAYVGDPIAVEKLRESAELYRHKEAEARRELVKMGVHPDIID